MYSISVQPGEVKNVLGKYILADGFDFTLDLEKSQGCFLHDSLNNRDILDFFTYFATATIGHNHPKVLSDEEFKKNMLMTAIANPSNSDIYTTQYATFMEVFARVALPAEFKHCFFISGGTLAVENALKTAMDWKVQKNFEKGYDKELGHQVIHFHQAFHGRSGYSLSITDTSPEKTKYFSKFKWPRILNPKIIFPLEENLKAVVLAEEEALRQINLAIADNKDDICAIIIEPIQSEGGDNHFRKEFLQQLRKIADQEEIMLVFDEVQTGVGLTGKFWAYEHFGVIPDIIAFGKKMQVCGIMSTVRIDEVEKNCFKASSRINSTWGGSLCDMVRATKFLQIIEEDKLLENARTTGEYLLKRLMGLSSTIPVSNVRGRGLHCAFDLPSKEMRDNLVRNALSKNLLLLPCGEKSIRFRPPLIVTPDLIDKGLKIIEEILKN